MAAKLKPLGGTQKKKGKLHPFIGVKMAVKLEPLGDRVVVKPSPKEEVTKSGIVIPLRRSHRRARSLLSVRAG
jgi:hypothetical protein